MTLSDIVNRQMAALDLTQSAFCREMDFDQGLLSKIMSGFVKRVSLESALRLSAGLWIDPCVVFEACGRPEWEELIEAVYGKKGTGRVKRSKRKEKGLHNAESM